MPRFETIVLIPESTRKRKDGQPGRPVDSFTDGLPPAARKELGALRDEVRAKSPKGSIDPGGLLPAYRRFDGNMYRRIEAEDWDRRVPTVEVVIASGLLGLVASRDPIPAYTHSMAEPTPPFGKLNRWWHAAGLPEILAAYLGAIRPEAVVDLLSQEYRESVAGYADRLSGIEVKTVDFPGLGRGSQPKRGEMVARFLGTGTD